MKAAPRPFPPERPQLAGRGSLRHVILAALDEAPATGYGLGRLLRSELAHLRTARLQQIYVELARLNAESLAAVETLASPRRGPVERKLYSITPQGRRALASWLVGPPGYVPARDDLLVHLYCLKEETRSLVTRRIEERREECETLLVVLRRRLEEASQPNSLRGLGYALSLEAAIAGVEAQVRWCEAAVTRMRSPRSM